MPLQKNTWEAATGDIARLVEVAAMDYHLKDMGIDMAGEFNRRLMSNFQSSEN